MNYRNDGSNEINAVQNQFTAYLTKALRNARAQYIRNKVRRLQIELAIEELEYLGIPAENQMEELAKMFLPPCRLSRKKSVMWCLQG